MGDEKKQPAPKTTLRDDEIESNQKADRRGVLATLGAGAIAAMAAGVASLMPRNAEASGTPDPHEGEGAQEGGEVHGGEQPVIAQCTDSDGGRFADPPGRGRRCARRYYIRRRCTDSDGGRWADPPGRGRRC